ncbi:hypothetical protein BT96DRAFT_365238 [Gymnopus androsaceus JB14]|uniref:Uncharacterized protein n=1 Tax=Gymnopus androsaceus JB14 TaxID=1447944 RepID=A0A6A4GX13_9AGAR|nr:hypothetical protein BT96DRAFT_365238 [Gymnopus androsaceus JB14]
MCRNLQIDCASGIHLKNLKNLDVVSPLGPWPVTLTMNDGVWAVLGHYRVKLKHIYAPVTAELIDYLQTYSGVENLRLYGTVDAGLAQRLDDDFALACNFTKSAEHLSCTGESWGLRPDSLTLTIHW